MSQASSRRRLPIRARHALVSLHVISSVGLLGFVLTVLLLAATAIGGARDTRLAAYDYLDLAEHTLGPGLTVTAAITGIVLALRTNWGLLDYWWVSVKLVLTVAVIVTSVVLVDAFIDRARDAAQAGDSFDIAQARLVVATSAHALTLAFATAISVFKPWGRTPIGRRASLRRASLFASGRTRV